MHAREVKVGALYWWQAKQDCRVLVRCTGTHQQFFGFRVVSATAQQVIATGYGVGEFVQLGANALTLEKAA